MFSNESPKAGLSSVFLKIAFCFDFSEEQMLKITKLRIHRRLPASLLKGLGDVIKCSLSVQHGRENWIADHKRVKNAQQHSHCGSEIVLRPDGGVDRLSF